MESLSPSAAPRALTTSMRLPFLTKCCPARTHYLPFPRLQTPAFVSRSSHGCFSKAPAGMLFLTTFRLVFVSIDMERPEASFSWSTPVCAIATVTEIAVDRADVAHALEVPACPSAPDFPRGAPHPPAHPPAARPPASFPAPSPAPALRQGFALRPAGFPLRG